MAKLNVENLTVVMRDESATAPSAYRHHTSARDFAGPQVTSNHCDEIELAKLMLRKAVRVRNSVIGSSPTVLKVAHEDVMLLRSVVADLESGA